VRLASVDRRRVESAWDLRQSTATLGVGLMFEPREQPNVCILFALSENDPSLLPDRVKSVAFLLEHSLLFNPHEHIGKFRLGRFAIHF